MEPRRDSVLPVESTISLSDLFQQQPKVLEFPLYLNQPTLCYERYFGFLRSKYYKDWPLICEKLKGLNGDEKYENFKCTAHHTLNEKLKCETCLKKYIFNFGFNLFFPQTPVI